MTGTPSAVFCAARLAGWSSQFGRVVAIATSNFMNRQLQSDGIVPRILECCLQPR